MTFTFEIEGGHILALVDGRRLLVDTGSPGSFGRPGAFVGLAGETPVPKEQGGHDIDKVVEFVGAPVDGLVGMDLIRLAGGLEIDWRAKRISFGRPSPEGQLVAADLGRGIVRVDVPIDDTPVRAIVDTGAFVSYVVSSVGAGATPAGTFDDFHLSFGRYTADLRDLRHELLASPRTHRFAVTPPRVEQIVTHYGARAIIGTDLLQTFDVVGLDTSAGHFVFRGG
jgi:hypothetical protein